MRLRHSSNPYVGILTFLVAPAFFFAGLMVLLFGAWRWRRKLAKANGSAGALRINIDLSRAHDRRVLAFFVPASAGFLLLTAMGSYHTYHFTESVQFCGESCHTVMKPELTTYLHSPHARVACAECHIGKGATWYVRSKLSGTYQVYATLAHKYPDAHPHAGARICAPPRKRASNAIGPRNLSATSTAPSLIICPTRAIPSTRCASCSKSAAAIRRTGRWAASIGT